jgi:hypothetical protein
LAKKWGKLSIADALKSARSVPRIIKGGAAGRRSPEEALRQRPVQHSSSEEPPTTASLSRVSSKREKYLKVMIIFYSVLPGGHFHGCFSEKCATFLKLNGREYCVLGFFPLKGQKFYFRPFDISLKEH